MLFTLYTTPLRKIIANHDVSHHLYADDTQIYTNELLSLEKLKACLQSISMWMAHSKN